MNENLVTPADAASVGSGVAGGSIGAHRAPTAGPAAPERGLLGGPGDTLASQRSRARQ